ncbi:MAG: insulinase family protein [Acidobacteria bacterium]|nr:insulinase family protein [Acidobacteriota bacterium]
MSKYLVSFLFVVAVWGQALPPGVQRKASVGGITEYQYPNGLRLLLYPDASNPKVTVNMTYLVGSRHEGYGESGMAHLLEHLNFIETTNGRQIKKELVDHGAQWNGTTWFDRTNYYETVSSTDENLRWALGLEADRMVNVRMEKKILDTEMTVVRNEFERGENSPQRVLEERVMSTAFLWHNYGKSTIGSRADLERVPIDRLAAFYRKYYRPDNAVLTLAGNLDVPKTLAMVSETLGRIPRPASKIETTYTTEPVQDGERYVELRRVGSNQEVLIAYHAPSAAHPDAAALRVLSGIMGGGGFRFGAGGPGLGRLSKALVENKKALSASMSFQALHDPGVVQVSAGLNMEQSLDDVRKTIYETIDGIVKEPPSQEELDRAKNRLLRSMEQRMADSQQVGLGMTTPISQGDWRILFLEHESVKGVTADDIVRVARTYFKASNRTVGVFIPTAEPDRTIVPDTPDLDKVFDKFTTTVSVAQGESFEPTPANIEKRLVRIKLKNGLRVAILPKKTSGGTILAALELHFGDESTLAGKNAAISMAASLLMRGTKTKNRQQLQDAIDKLNARVFAGGGGGGGRGGRGGGGGGSASASGIGASIEAKGENFLPALRLAVEILKDPAFPESDFEQIRKQRMAGIDAARTDPAMQAGLLLGRHISTYPKGHPLYVGTLEEQADELKKLTLDDVKKFHAGFYGAQHAELIVVGPVDQAALLAEAEALLGMWQSPVKYQRMASTFKKIPAMNEKIETPDKENAQFEAALRVQMNDAHADYPAMILANYMFGGTIAARMPNRIRNVEGLSYGARSSFSAPSEGDAAIFSASVISNPGNAPKVEKFFLEELNKALKDGFTEAELTAAKKAVKDQMMVGRAQDQALLRGIAIREQRERTLLWDEQHEAKLQAASLDQVNTAFRRHIDPSQLSIVKGGDFKKAGVWQ